MKRFTLPLLALALAGCANTPAPTTMTTKPALPEDPSTPARIAPIHGPSNPEPARRAGFPIYASIVGLDPAKEKLYRELHADVWPEVIAAIRKANIRNFNIYVADIGGKRYLVSTFEYHGSNPDADFASIAADPVTRDKWWPLTDGCQIRLPGTPEGAQWKSMEQVMHLP